MSALKATLLTQNRVAYAETAFAEVVVWRLPRPLAGSAHAYKYRLAFVLDGVCVLRYDNESGKGDHRHMRDGEVRYRFTSLEGLFADFAHDVRRILDEDNHA